MKITYILLFLVSILNITYAQHSNLYHPKEYKEALKKGTRSLDGQPGKNYWINRTDYIIDVNLDPITNKLDAKQKLTYHNNSPDTLDQLVFRIYQDFYKKGNARDWQINPDQLFKGVEIYNIKINGIYFRETEGEKVRTGTNLVLKLDKDQKIAPDSKTKIEMEFTYKFPDFSAVRMGSYDSTSMFVAHWYPQMSVYDDIDGWDVHNYFGTYEFYNDFGNFDVNITVPKDFVVWATGELTNYKEVLSPVSAYRYELSNKRNDIINIIKKEDLEKGGFTRQRDFNTWKFKAKRIPDFAFSTSDHYLWDRTSVVVDDVMGRRVAAEAAYKVESEDFYEVAGIAQRSVKYFSKELPGIPYPWPEVTVFNGAGGMEFPMMVNDGSFSDIDITVGVTSHEIAHMYMPFYLGTNERKYAFMDEGWAVMLPFEFQTREMKDRDPIASNNMGYEAVAGKELDVPLMVPSVLSRGWAYRNMSYGRPGAAYFVLQNIMGKTKFRRALKQYGNFWAEKHPVPFDFFYTFEEVHGESLEWFWKPWFFEFGVPDLAIDHINENMINIKKIGALPIPIYLEIEYTDGEKEVIEVSAKVWKDKDLVEIRSKYRTNFKKVVLGNDHIPDADRSNNVK